MPTFYPVNNPLINYFFYKAPFIQNNYVFTAGIISGAGTSYNVGDVIILGGGTFTAPAVIVVSAVSSGAITAFTITSGGNYSVTPSTLNQFATSGVGSGLILNPTNFAPLNLIPPGPNVPLSGGFIFFYEDENRTVKANTYSDVSDPNNPTVNPNPLHLGAAGDAPLYYLDDRLYYIVITDETADQSNPVQVIEHYNPADASSTVGTSAFNDNFLVNPQFNYPIEFWKVTDTEGEISQASTVVAWGWVFHEDVNTLSENFITFEDISGQEIEGSPIFQLLLNCNVVSSSETLKDIIQIFGAVDFLSEMPVTFSAQMINEFSGNISVNLILELNYGMGGSPTRLIPLTTFTVTSVRQKFIYSFTMPSIATYTIGDGNYMAIHVQPELGQTCKFGITNTLLEPGIVVEPIFADEPKSFAKSQILGNSTLIQGAGLNENYSIYFYNNGVIFPHPDTGTITLQTNNSPQAFRQICDGSSFTINGYSPSNIPYERLYDIIGNTFGGSGSLIVSSSGNVATFRSGIGGRELSAYTGGTTSFTTSNTVRGLAFGINLVNNNDNTVAGTFVEQFAPSQTTPTFMNNAGNAYVTPGAAGLLTYWGAAATLNPNNISFATTNPGSPSANATFTMSFNTPIIALYQSTKVNIGSPVQTVVSNFIEFATFANNNRQPTALTSVNQLIQFSVDGQYDGLPSPDNNVYVITSSKNIVVPLISAQSLQQNINTFIKAVANPFQWTVTVVSVPLAGQYFLFSDITTDYYGWFTVDGVGTDPMVPGRTAVPIAIFTGNTPTQVAAIMAETINDLEFAVPSTAQLPALVVDSKVSWYINL